MEKSYNLSLLFKEDEFDAEKGYDRYGTKEAYFAVLHRFTLDVQTILRYCASEAEDIDADTLTRYVNRLQGMLANIGAVGLAWRIQSLYHYVEKKYFTAYLRELGRVLPDVERLRQRIVSAEKTSDDGPMRAVPSEESQPASERAASSEESQSVPERAVPPEESQPASERAVPPEESQPASERAVSSEESQPASERAASSEESQPASEQVVRRVKLRQNEFHRLLMLVDNFELESAVAAAHAIMQYSYTPEIDDTLRAVCEELYQFRFAEALEAARKLMGLVLFVQASETSPRKRILAIDDMPDVLRTVKAMLRDRYHVAGVTDYQSAVRYLRSNTADLILLDIEMPGLDGFAMLQLFRLLPEYAETPVVFLTANVSDEHIRMAMQLGARDFIKKPVDLAVLVGKLEKALG